MEALDTGFEGKVALVTGAASGIGRASALLFARGGARVVVADVAAGSFETVRLIEAAGGTATFIRADVTSEPEVEALVRDTLRTYGRLDCAHNNAGVAGGGVPFHETSLEAWRRVLAINVTGVFLCMKQEIAAMLPEGGGAIVNTSSGVAVTGAPRSPAYAASKAGVLALTKTAALEYRRRGIRVNAICPGYTDTPMTQSGPLPRSVEGFVGTPEQVASTAVWLCSPAAQWVDGVTLHANGGLGVF